MDKDKYLSGAPGAIPQSVQIGGGGIYKNFVIYLVKITIDAVNITIFMMHIIATGLAINFSQVL